MVELKELYNIDFEQRKMLARGSLFSLFEKLANIGLDYNNFGPITAQMFVVCYNIDKNINDKALDYFCFLFNNPNVNLEQLEELIKTNNLEKDIKMLANVLDTKNEIIKELYLEIIGYTLLANDKLNDNKIKFFENLRGGQYERN